MDIRRLTECFQGTLFADDYRTDLTVAAERIAMLEARMSSDAELNDKSGLLLAQAIYSSICGDFVCATDYLNQLSTLAQKTNDSSLLARCKLYQVYFRCAKNLPPFFRFRVDSDTGPGVVRSIGISALRSRLIREQSGRSTPELSLLDRLEAKILRACTNFVEDFWLEAFPEHPQYIKNHPIVLFRKERNYWDNVRQPGSDSDLPAMASYFDTLTLQYRLAGNATNARSLSLSMYDAFSQRRDLIAAANCQLLLGDTILSPPFTSPFALNLISVAREVGWANEIWDKKEQGFSLKQNMEAMQCYQKAHSLFEEGGSQRGKAAVFLRYACLKLADAILVPKKQDAKTAEELAEDLVNSAYEHLIMAKELFEGDITNSLIVNGHLTICHIFRNELSTALEISFDIGDTGRRTGNTCTAEFAGMLHLRLARRLSLDKARQQDSVVLCACAAVCFKALANPYLELHAVAASAKLHQQRGDIPKAKTHVRIGRKLLDRALMYFDSLEAEVRALRTYAENQEHEFLDHDLQMLRSKRTSCMTDFDSLASAIEGPKQKADPSPSNQSAQQPGASPMVAMLQSFQGSGLDPSLMARFQSLIAGATSIDDWRKKYEGAIKCRRDALVLNADIDSAEEHLTKFLVDVERCSIFSEEIEIRKTMAFQYLGDFDSARSAITRILPKSFGGTRIPLPEPEGAGEQIKDMMAKNESQKFDRAISLCFAAKDWKRGMKGIENMLRLNPTSLDDLKTSNDPHVWYNMVWIACILEKNGHIGWAFELYLDAFKVVEAHREQLADIKDRRDIFSTIHSGELFLGLARIAFQFSSTPGDSLCGPSEQWKLPPGAWKGQGLRFLELGRSRTLLDILIARKLAPQKLRDWSEYSYQLRLKEVLDSTENAQETTTQSAEPNESESRETYLQRVHKELMTELELQRFPQLLPESATITESNEKLFKCIPQSAIVLHVNSSREGLIILCITSQGIIDIHTAETTDLELNRHIFRFAKLFREVRRPDPSSLPSITTYEPHLQAISDQILRPITEHIKAKEHVIFVPSPSLNKFPLCALTYDNKPLFLSKDVSQIPSLSVLLYSADRKHNTNNKVSVIYKDPDPRLRDQLNLSTACAINIAHSFHSTPQPATATLSHETFNEMYEQSNVLLIATHSIQKASAWESSLLLLDPPLRVLDLARLRSTASLIIFEACVSGLGEESIGNDLLGFSHAVLASGASAFLGGLWSVSDEASALLMLFLFEEIRSSEGNNNKTLARCWRNAQTRLYELDVTGVVALFEIMRKDCFKAYQAGLIDKELAAQLRWTLSITIKDIKDAKRPKTDFKHPFYWAPFVLMGDAGAAL
jgi:CHAT domain-containing protein